MTAKIERVNMARCASLGVWATFIDGTLRVGNARKGRTHG